MKVYKHRVFHQWAKSEELKDEVLRQAIDEINAGLYEANLGSGLYKKRIAMPGKGKRGGYRTLLAFKKDQRAFFIYGFAKNTLENINKNERNVYRKLAEDLLNMNISKIQEMLNNGKLFEVK